MHFSSQGSRVGAVKKSDFIFQSLTKSLFKNVIENDF